MNTNQTKRFWIRCTVALLLLFGAILFVGMLPTIFPSLYVSEVYKKYADDEHVAATFLRNFRVNDSVTVDVTLLKARDDEGWERLQKDFNATPPPPPEVIEILGEDFDGVEVWLAPKNNYALPMDSVLLNNDLLSISFKNKSICIFDTESEAQMDAVSSHQHDEGHTPVQQNNK